jgi:hypothetical protein
VFLLKKWYFDLVTPEGTAFIGYSARLKWGPLKTRYRAVLLFRPDRPAEETFTLRRSPDPECLPDGSVAWNCAPLGVSGTWCPKVDRIRRRLFECASGGADWDCVAPAAEVTLRVGRETLEGWGYAEQLILTAPPWDFGAWDLHWGRFVAPATSVIWVHWEGSGALPRVMVNGVERPGATATVEEVVLPGTEGRLELDSRRALREGPVVSVLAALPPLARRLPGDIDGVVERKWLSPGRWISGENAPVSGWAIHEVVEWHTPGLT